MTRIPRISQVQLIPKLHYYLMTSGLLDYSWYEKVCGLWIIGRLLSIMKYNLIDPADSNKEFKAADPKVIGKVS